MRQIILDTETTGLEYAKGHRLTEIGCLEMVNRRLTGRKFQAYINPEREIDPGAVKITGLTAEFLSDKPKFQEVAADFVAFLQEEEAELIIHNAPFDLGFLNYELGLINHPFSPIENYLNIIDTLVLARQMHPGQRNSLDALCKRYNVNNSNREFHGALLDANLLVEVYLAMTAGQTAMSFFSVETTVKEDKNKPFHVKKMTRANDLQLKVIRASEAEVQLHEARLAELQARK